MQKDAEIRDWKAYEDLTSQADGLGTCLPLISELAKPSVKPRHWKELFSKVVLPYLTTRKPFSSKTSRESHPNVPGTGRGNLRRGG